MAYPNSVKSTLSSEIDTVAKNIELWCKKPKTDFTRRRKMPAEKLIDLIITMESNSLNIELLRASDFDPCAARASAFCQAREKLKPEAFLEILKQFNLHYGFGDYRHMCPIACDGTTIALPRCSAQTSTYLAPSKCSPRGRNAVHLTALYDLGAKRYLDGVVQAENRKNEFACFCAMIDRWEYESLTPLFILDRGIASYNVYAHVIEIGGFFVIRFDERKLTRLLGRDIGQNECFDEDVSRILVRSNAKTKRLQPQREQDYRHICREVQFDFITEKQPEYEIELRVARFRLNDDSFETVVTNLPRNRFDPEELKRIYWMRWGIETSFRHFKYSVGASAVHSSNLEYASQEIYARMIAYNAGSVIIEHAITAMKGYRKRKHIYKVNFSLALKICLDFLRGKTKASMRGIEKAIRMNVEPERKGRTYERRKKAWIPPPSFMYRFS